MLVVLLRRGYTAIFLGALCFQHVSEDMCCASSKTRTAKKWRMQGQALCILRLHQYPVEAAHRRTHLSILILYLHKQSTNEQLHAQPSHLCSGFLLLSKAENSFSAAASHVHSQSLYDWLAHNLRQWQRSPYFRKYRCLAALPLEVDAEQIFWESEELWAGLVAKGGASEPLSKFLNSSTCRVGNNVNSKIATVHATRNLEERLMCARVFQYFAKKTSCRQFPANSRYTVRDRKPGSNCVPEAECSHPGPMAVGEKQPGLSNSANRNKRAMFSSNIILRPMQGHCTHIR